MSNSFTNRINVIADGNFNSNKILRLTAESLGLIDPAGLPVSDALELFERLCISGDSVDADVQTALSSEFDCICCGHQGMREWCDFRDISAAFNRDWWLPKSTWKWTLLEIVCDCPPHLSGVCQSVLFRVDTLNVYVEGA